MKKMKLSDELAKPSSNMNICRNDSFFTRDLKEACVLGSVYVRKCGGRTKILREMNTYGFRTIADNCYDNLVTTFPQLDKTIEVPAELFEVFRSSKETLFDFIVILNDKTKMTRKQIAKEVAKLGY